MCEIKTKYIKRLKSQGFSNQDISKDIKYLDDNFNLIGSTKEELELYWRNIFMETAKFCYNHNLNYKERLFNQFELLRYISLSADEILDLMECCEAREKTVKDKKSLNKCYYDWFRDFIILNFNYSSFKLFMATATYSFTSDRAINNDTLRFSHENIYANRTEQISKEYNKIITKALSHPGRIRIL